jgi:hypothetical protein
VELRTKPVVWATMLLLSVTTNPGVARGGSDASDRSVKGMSIMLAQNGFTSGAVLSVSGFMKLEAGSSGTTDTQTANARVTGDMLPGVLAGFQVQHPEFVVQHTKSSVRFVQQDAPRDVLDKLSRSGITAARDQISISAALVEVVGSLINQRSVSGVLGSGSTPGPGCPVGAPVKVTAGQATPTEALDSLVSQVPGLSWFVLYDSTRVDEPIQAGIWCQDGMYFRVQLSR